METKVFGRRTEPPPVRANNAAPSRPSNTRSADAEVKQASTTRYRYAVERLAGGAARLNLASQLLAFIGLVGIYYASANWPVDPTDMVAVGDRLTYVLVPPILESEAHAVGVTRTFSAITAFSASGQITGQLIWSSGLIFLFFFIAAFRRRYYLAISIIVLMMFPWELFGHYVFGRKTFILAAVCIFVFAAIPARGIKRIGFLAVGVLVFYAVKPTFLPLIAPLANYGPPPVTYGLYSMADLKGAGAAGRPSRNSLSVSSFAEVDVEAADKLAAKAFVVAVESARLGDMASAARNLEFARNSGFDFNRFEGFYLDRVEANVAASGYYGQARAASVKEQYARDLLTSRIILWLGIALNLLGPLTDLLAAIKRRRAQRIDSGITTLERDPSVADPASTAPGKATIVFRRLAKRVFGRERPGTGLAGNGGNPQAIAATAVLDQRAIRLFTLSIGFACAAALAFFFQTFFYLPREPFDAAALSWNVAKLAAMSGIVSAKAVAATESLVAAPSWAGVAWPVWLVPAALFFLMRSKLPAILLAIALFVYGQATVFGPGLSQPVLTADASAFDDRLVELLDARLPADAVPGATDGLYRDQIPMFRSTIDRMAPTPPHVEYRSFEQIPGSKLLRFMANRVSPVEAAFALAQIAFLRNDPANCAKYLSLIAEPREIRLYNHQIRMVLMREWTEAQGYPVVGPAWSYVYGMAPATRRLVADILFVIVVATIVLALIFAGASIFAVRRRVRLTSLIRGGGALASRQWRDQ